MTKDEAKSRMVRLEVEYTTMLRADIAADISGAPEHVALAGRAAKAYAAARKAFLKDVTRAAGESPAEALLELEQLTAAHSRYAMARALLASDQETVREEERQSEVRACRAAFEAAVLEAVGS